MELVWELVSYSERIADTIVNYYQKMVLEELLLKEAMRKIFGY